MITKVLLSSAVDRFKEDLSLAAFQQSCVPLTQAFAVISGKVRQVQLKLSTKPSEEAIFEETESLGKGLGEMALSKMVHEIQMLEKTHLE